MVSIFRLLLKMFYFQGKNVLHQRDIYLFRGETVQIYKLNRGEICVANVIPPCKWGDSG